MDSVTLSRRVAAEPAAVRERVRDVEPFVRAGGFDEVVVDGDRVEITNRVGIATIELTLELFEDPDAVLAYRQREGEGVFEEMVTTYTVTPANGGSVVTATTEFAIDVGLVGELLDATVISRQRRREIEAQFDWLEAELA